MKYVFCSQRLAVQPVTEAEIQNIHEIFASNADLLQLLDREHDPRIHAEQFVFSRILPPNGISNQMYNLTLRRKDTQSIVGLLGLYEGYPTAHIAYLGQLFLHTRYQGQGLGQEIYEQLENYLRLRAIRAVRVGVALRNWNALRFWIKRDFLHITGMSGDRNFSSQKHAFLELQKKL